MGRAEQSQDVQKTSYKGTFVLRVNLTLTDWLAHPGIGLSRCRMLAQQQVKDNRLGLGFPEVLVRVSEAAWFVSTVSPCGGTS